MPGALIHAVEECGLRVDQPIGGHAGDRGRVHSLELAPPSAPSRALVPVTPFAREHRLDDHLRVDGRDRLFRGGDRQRFLAALSSAPIAHVAFDATRVSLVLRVFRKCADGECRVARQHRHNQVVLCELPLDRARPRQQSLAELLVHLHAQCERPNGLRAIDDARAVILDGLAHDT
jgi:hypothetical protein